MSARAVIRLGDERMNSTETKYAEMLDLRARVGEICSYRFQALTLRLGDDLRYTPDFLVHMPDGELHFHEVKGGFIREDARVKLFAAAEQWPYFRFFLCQFERRTGWTITEVKR